MASSTITLQGTINATLPLIGYRPLIFSTLSTPIYEPAVTMANKVKSALLMPPLVWPWNRIGTAPTQFTCNPSQSTPTDYPVTIANFGWIEWASVNDQDSNNPLWRPMQRVGSLSIAEEEGLPRSIAAQYNNGSGQITFRVAPSPDIAYVVQFDMQAKASLFPQSSAALAQTWAPIPDEFSDLYTWGFEALALALNGDPRFAEYNQKFMAGVLARNQGLSEVERTEFVNLWMGMTAAQDILAERMKQGIQARQV